MASPQDTAEILPHGTIRVHDNNNDVDLVLYPQPTRSPDDPLNWSVPRKVLSASIVLFITAFTAATSNNFGSAGTVLNDDPYDISWNEQNTAAGVLFIGIGYGTLLLSSAPWLYGRRISYLICLLWSIAGNIWFARVKTTQDAIWSQLFVGGSEAVAEATVQLSLFDVFFQHQRGLVLGLYVLATSVGTFIGPLIGGYIADSDLGWSWVGWFAAIFSGAAIVVTYFGLEETFFERDIVLSGSSPSHGTVPQETPVSIEKNNSSFPRQDEVHVLSVRRDGDHVVRPGKTYWQRIALITPSATLLGTGFKQYFFRMWNNIRIFWFPAVLYAGVQWGFQDAWLTFCMKTPVIPSLPSPHLPLSPRHVPPG